MSLLSMRSLQMALPSAHSRPPVAAAVQRPLCLRSSFVGAPVQLAGKCSLTAVLPQNGCLWTGMRHGVKGYKLGRPADQRRALVRGLVTELLRHGRIKTTKVKAKAIRKPTDKMIILAKRGTLHARRQAAGYIYDKVLVRALFVEAPKRFANRSCGFTRIKTEEFLRRGDAAEMATIELV